jgi:prevent-host-death family protein
MRTVNISAAKAQLSRLVESAANGEGFIITKAGKPLVKVLPFDPTAATKPQRIGFMDGAFTVPDDFDTMFAAEIEEMFYGRDE